jgi:hypothetical protein
MNQDFKDKIIAARPTNLGRLVASVVFIIIANLFGLKIFEIISYFHFIVGLSWLYIVERHYTIYESNPRFWYLNALIDIFTLTIFVYLTGTTNSFVIIGYVVITTLSSIDLNKKRGRFAVILGILLYSILSFLVYFNVFPYINIFIDQEVKITLLSIIISIVLLTAGNVASNLVIFEIYSQLNDKNEELSNKYDEIKKLKFQQDGDYYLTSLLIEPLLTNEVNSERIKIEYYLDQYKKFTFRNMQKDIGGDVILCSSIILNSQKFFVFINGDAMGKSIQGAGGALVLGVVLKSVLSRNNEEIVVNLPEDWILNTYNELQKIFESFDGLMLVSAIIGLMNEKTGLVYYLNLEHPNIILYRSKVASYVELRNQTPKIGTPYIKKPKEVNLFQLFSGDTLFVGSDGKDDLMKITGEAHNKYNYDESQFLRIIEKNEGNMEQIIKSIPEYGIIIDDFSILKITYT